MISVLLKYVRTPREELLVQKNRKYGFFDLKFRFMKYFQMKIIKTSRKSSQNIVRTHPEELLVEKISKFTLQMIESTRYKLIEHSSIK